MRDHWILSLCLVSLLTSSGLAADSSSILIISDSHGFSAYGEKLIQGLREGGSRSVRAVGSCGSSAASWFSHSGGCGTFRSDGVHPPVKVNPPPLLDGSGRPVLDKHGRPRTIPVPTPDLGETLASAKPGVAVISLGTNQLPLGESSSSKDQIRQMMSEIHHRGIQCIWVGPPEVRCLLVHCPDTPQERVRAKQKLAQFYAALASVAAEKENPCQVVDSRPLASYPSAQPPGKEGDGVHFTSFPQIAESWGTQAARQVLSRIGTQGKPAAPPATAPQPAPASPAGNPNGVAPASDASLDPPSMPASTASLNPPSGPEVASPPSVTAVARRVAPHGLSRRTGQAATVADSLTPEKIEILKRKPMSQMSPAEREAYLKWDASMTEMLNSAELSRVQAANPGTPPGALLPIQSRAVSDRDAARLRPLAGEAASLPIQQSGAAAGR